MENSHLQFDQSKEQNNNSLIIESESKITGIWSPEDRITPQKSTDESDFNNQQDQQANSHMQWHLRDLPIEMPVIETPRSEIETSFQDYALDQSMTNRQHKKKKPFAKYSILICTDFAFPKFGGVETHGYQLAQCLIERGHKVTFITNKYQNTRCGIRYMANGLKVYHLPHIPVIQGDVAFLSVFNSLPLIRQILVREHVDIVHGHQSTSVLQHVILMAAKSYGLKTVFTEHSLFGYNDFTGIHLNKLIKWTFRDLDAAICVSHACKDNFVLRAKVDPRQAFTIPNAVDSQKFTPNPRIREKEIEKSGNPDQINIVFISRLQYRKGVDLLLGIIPKVLAQFPNVNFIIGGDGTGMSDLLELVERHNLHGRVELLGGLPHEKVRDVLCRGHIFLNTSLTESFCIAILEAACCGLLVVTTDVGGVPEVLPQHMAYLAKPEEKSILRQLRSAINNVNNISTEQFYDQVAELYSWRQVAERTEKVYDYAMDQTVPNMMSRIKSTFAWGPIIGLWALIYTVIEGITLCLANIFLPEDQIDICQSFSSEQYCEQPEVYGDHQVFVSTEDTRYQCPKHKHMKIIDENFKSFENRTNKPFNNQQRYINIKPKLLTKIQINESSSEYSDKEEDNDIQKNLLTLVMPQELESELDKSKESNSDSDLSTNNKSQLATQTETKSASDEVEIRSDDGNNHCLYCQSCSQHINSFEDQNHQQYKRTSMLQEMQAQPKQKMMSQSRRRGGKQPKIKPIIHCHEPNYLTPQKLGALNEIIFNLGSSDDKTINKLVQQIDSQVRPTSASSSLNSTQIRNEPKIQCNQQFNITT